MRSTGWLVCALLVLLALAPVAAEAPVRGACGEEGRHLLEACKRVVEEMNRAIALATAGKLAPKGRATYLYQAYNLRGGAYQAMARRYDANEDARRATELHRRAIEDFDAAIRLDAKQPHAFLNRGSSWAGLAEPRRAIQDFEQFLRLSPANPLGLNNRGGAYGDNGEFNKAIADLDQAIALSPKYANAYVNRGSIYLQRKDYDRAIADLDAGLRYGARDVYVLSARGRAWRDKGDETRAEADFEAALALQTTDKRSAAVQDAVRELLRALKEKAQREQAETRRKAELDRIERERIERERLELAKAERERAERERAEQAALAAAEQAAREKAALEQAAAERARREEAARAEAEREQAAREKARLADAARKKAELEQAEREHAAREKAAREKAEQAALELAAKARREEAERERAEAERRQREEAEHTAAKARRIALVLGNSAYHSRSLYPLRNPRNDAAAIAKAFEALDFTVLVGIDRDGAQTAELMDRFLAAARGAEVAVLFFAGHGLESNGVPYLAPVDADLPNLATFVDLEAVEARMQSEHGVRILLIDACRTRVRLAAPAGKAGPPVPAVARGVLGIRGLGRADRAVAHGLLIAYAATAGEAAEDGARVNSPFTGALLRHVLTPGLDLRGLLDLVRYEVAADTNGRQHPVNQDGLMLATEKFYLKPVQTP